MFFFVGAIEGYFHAQRKHFSQSFDGFIPNPMILNAKKVYAPYNLGFLHHVCRFSLTQTCHFVVIDGRMGELKRLKQTRTGWGNSIRRDLYLIDVYALLQCMLARQMSMSDVAKEIGVTKQALSYRLKDSHLVTERFVVDFEKALNMSRRYFATTVIARPGPDEQKKIKDLRRMVGGRIKKMSSFKFQRSGSFVLTAGGDPEESE